jgi:hypothetical protein
VAHICAISCKAVKKLNTKAQVSALLELDPDIPLKDALYIRITLPEKQEQSECQLSSLWYINQLLS